MLIKFKLLDWYKDENWKKFKNTYATKIRKASEIEQAEGFMSGVLQGICFVTPECEKIHAYGTDCSITFGRQLSLKILDPEGDFWLDELEVEVETMEEDQ